MRYSDFIVYVDESGDHSLDSINPNYPLFVLSFCTFRKDNYSHVVTPALRMLKFCTFGHDMVVLHEYDIRKKIGFFKNLNKESREAFLEELSQLIDQTDFTLIPIVIDKHKIKKHDFDFSILHIYHLAMRIGLEKLYQYLSSQGQINRITHIVFEARGRSEDFALELEFHRICKGNNSFQMVLPFEIVIADKKCNSEGLQFADMVARPIGISVLRPEQANRAAKILERKFYPAERKEREKSGPFIFPLESEKPLGSPEGLAPVR